MEKKNSRVLIVDDDEDVLLAARMLLKPHASYISTEKNPALLPNYLRDDSYDVIFLDMNFSKDTTGGAGRVLLAEGDHESRAFGGGDTHYRLWRRRKSRKGD